MHPVIQKTLGGLSSAYYLRQLFFGFLLAAFFFTVSTQGGRFVSMGAVAFIICNTLLYPYSRFVYEGIVSFVVGNNVFFVNAVFMLITKIFTMTLCWALALMVAPIGFAYLYYNHGKVR